MAGLAGPLSIAAGMPKSLRSLSVAQLRDCGVARVSLPALAIFAAMRAVWEVFASVRDTGAFDEVAAKGLLWSMEDLARL